MRSTARTAAFPLHRLPLRMVHSSLFSVSASSAHLSAAQRHHPIVLRPARAGGTALAGSGSTPGRAWPSRCLLARRTRKLSRGTRTNTAIRRICSRVIAGALLLRGRGGLLGGSRDRLAHFRVGLDVLHPVGVPD